MVSMRDVALLGVCRQVEAAAARLYHLYAKLHRDDAGMSSLWLKTAREEENHARQIEMVMRRHARISAVVRADPEKAQKALTLLEETIAHSMLTTPPIRRALEEAITIENAFMQFHADYAVEFSDSSDQRLFSSMMAADRDHVGALQAALDALTGR